MYSIAETLVSGRIQHVNEELEELWEGYSFVPALE